MIKHGKATNSDLRGVGTDRRLADPRVASEYAPYSKGARRTCQRLSLVAAISRARARIIAHDCGASGAFTRAHGMARVVGGAPANDQPPRTVATRTTTESTPSETRSLSLARRDQVSFTPVDLIRVSAWGRVVGFIARDPSTNYYAFEYDDEWIRNGTDLSPFHLPRQRGVFVFPQLSRETYYGLPAMVADALPDRFGNALVTAWLADQGV